MLLRLSVPELPAAFRERGYAQQQLMEALLDSAGAHSTAVTAPKSRISSQVRISRVCKLVSIEMLSLLNMVRAWAGSGRQC